MKVSIEVKGLAELSRKLEGKALYWEPVKEALGQLGKLGASDARSAAPSRTGALSASMTSKLNAKPMPIWVGVTTNVVGSSGKRYPWILEFDPKYGHKNWLKTAIQRAQSQAAGLLAGAISKIEAKWRA